MVLLTVLMTEIKHIQSPLPPNSTIGIIGGGQLGRMLASSAAKLGFRTVVLEPQTGCPAAQLCNEQIAAAYDDESALTRLIEICDVVTYEFENVPLEAARLVETTMPLSPPSEALRVSQNRLTEKNFLNGHNIPAAPFYPVSTVEDLAEGLKAFGGGVLKTCRFGYDGKGQHVFKAGDHNDADALQTVLKATGASGDGPLWVLEQLIAFEREFSIVAVRTINGTVTAFEAAQNAHENGILRRSVVPATVTGSHLAMAKSHVETILNALNYVGVIGVEFFDTSDGVLVNEIAPRVHNTGHWTVEACPTSQFDQHIRAITGLEAGAVERLVDCDMTNLLGDEAASIASYLADEDTCVTLYGKLETRPGRKMGHMTRLRTHRG